MAFPQINEKQRLARLQPPTDRAAMILDTDTFNEIVDQFALVCAMRPPDQSSTS